MSSNDEFRYIGKPVPPLDSWEKVTGKAMYVTDIQLPGMLFGKILRSPYAHARIMKIDTTKARQLPGVKAVVIFESTPRIRFGPMLSNEDWYIFAKDKVRFIGEEIAAVAALDEEIAEEALKLIDVQYELLPAVFDIEKAMQPGEPSVNEDWKNNIASEVHFEHGNVEVAFENSDLIMEETFTTSQVYQAYMEPMAAVVQPDGENKLIMWLPIQIPSKARLTYAKALGMRPEDIRIILPNIGGAFGAKFETNLHIACAILARKTGRPVKMVNDRTEDFIAGNPRVPLNYWIKMGFMNDGKITAKQVKVIGGNGARTVYGPGVVSAACYRADNLYTFTNVKVDGYCVYTNTVPTSCFRGYGTAQATFVLESVMDMAAEKLGISAEDIRKVNAITNNYISVHGWKNNTCGLLETLDRVLSVTKQRRDSVVQERGKYRGFGFACCTHISGNRGFFPAFDGSSSLVRIGDDGKITLFHGECDMGQGQNTVFAQIAAEVFGAKLGDVKIAQVDSQVSPFGMGSHGTRGTTIGGMGVKAAALAARDTLFATAATMMGVKSDELSARESMIYITNEPEKELSFSQVAQKYVFDHAGSPIFEKGYYVPDTQFPDSKTKYGNIAPAYAFGTHMAEVEIDSETGQVRVVGYWAANDVGRAINTGLLEGQVEGSVGMGIGWALMEDMVMKDGEILNASFLDYRTPGPKDVPRVQSMWVELVEPNGPFGAKGIGEPAFDPVVPAIANAINNAIGTHFKDLPITPEKVLEAIEKRANNQKVSIEKI
ncbi:MAG: xanthine dehydrogenase family protein molybdopterin-binding subunit [Desulfitobacteriaceae bacterium]